MTKLPRVTARKLVAALKRGGWTEVHHEGSHLYLAHPARVPLVVVPMHAGETVKPGLLLKILKQAGMTREELRDLL